MPTGKPVKKLTKGMGLYQVMLRTSQAPDKSKPWAVVNLETGDVNGRWHASKEEAQAQARALYARLGDKAKVHSEGKAVTNAFFLFADAANLVADDGVRWVEAIAPKTYHTPAYGEVEITADKIDNFVQSINTFVRGQEVAINYEHGVDPNKGTKAAGWIKGARKNDRGSLELAVDFTEPAKEEIRNKEWKYFSLEWDDEWVHPDGIFYKDVVMGGALTNRPVAKGLMPINFSEIFNEKTDEELAAELNETNNLAEGDPEHEFSVWSTAYVNNLPDSSFLFVESGGKKDSDGKTEPRSLRHLPYKDANGKVDLAHLRNAIARIPQMKGISEDLKNSLQGRARRLLDAKSMSELLEIDSEQKEWEHSEPGTGNPPNPRTDELESDDPDRKGGWRRETPPIAEDEADKHLTLTFSEAEAIGYLSAAIAPLKKIHTNKGDGLVEDIDRILSIPHASRSFNELQKILGEVRSYLRSNSDKGNDSKEFTETSEGGYTVGELTDKDLRELRNVLDVDDDARIVEAVKTKFGELAALRDAVSASDQERIFAEQYPQFYEQHRQLMERDRKNTAKAFTESIGKIKKAEGLGLKTTIQGFSTAVNEKIESVHMKFSEGQGTLEDFEDVLRSIVNGGIVTFGEMGSSNDSDIPEIDSSSPVGVSNARKIFAEQVAKYQRENPDVDYTTAINEVGKKHPDLAEAYRVTLPA